MHFCSAAKFLGAVFLDLITDGEARGFCIWSQALCSARSISSQG
jgi:hypothetical protein